MSRFFNIIKPFRIYRHVGISASNSYVGSSRAFTTVMNAENCRPGDTIHSLPGGLFLVRGKDCSKISLIQPKPLFEKSYGGSPTEGILNARIARSFLTEIDQPAERPHYYDASEAVSNNTFAEYHPGVIVIDPSPEYVRLVGLANIFAGALSDASEFIPKITDDTAHDAPKMTLSHHGLTIQFRCDLRGLWVVTPPGEYIGSVKPDPNYSSTDRETFWFTDPNSPKADVLIEHLALIADAKKVEHA